MEGHTTKPHEIVQTSPTVSHEGRLSAKMVMAASSLIHIIQVAIEVVARGKVELTADPSLTSSASRTTILSSKWVRQVGRPCLRAWDPWWFSKLYAYGACDVLSLLVLRETCLRAALWPGLVGDRAFVCHTKRLHPSSLWWGKSLWRNTKTRPSSSRRTSGTSFLKASRLVGTLPGMWRVGW